MLLDLTLQNKQQIIWQKEYWITQKDSAPLTDTAPLIATDELSLKSCRYEMETSTHKPLGDSPNVYSNPAILRSANGRILFVMGSQ